MMLMNRKVSGACLFVLIPFLVLASHVSWGDEPWVVYDGFDGPGAGKHIVLVSGDEEYRSEEALPQLGKILAKRHGFKCTVLFAIDPETGIINPQIQNNIPGLESLKTADLMIIFTRFRNLPDGQMQFIDDYLKSGRPVIGLRTSTHGFAKPKQKDGPDWSAWEHYGNGYSGPKKAWEDGFGRLVLGEKWAGHHGKHKHESTRGLIAPGAEDHPITRGIKNGDVWGSTDVYGVRLPLPGDSQPIVLGQVMLRNGESDDTDMHYGMRPTDDKPSTEKNDPMMPVAWTRTYQIPDGKKGRAFTSTVVASADLMIEGSRRLLVNGVYWCVGMEGKIPAGGTDVTLVGKYNPTAYKGQSEEHWKEANMKPSDFGL
jgi:hypothetical protein